MPRLPNLLYVLFLIPRCLSSSVFQNTKALMVLLLLVLCFSESILATMMPCCNWTFLKRFELLTIWIWGHKPISNSQNQIHRTRGFQAQVSKLWVFEDLYQHAGRDVCDFHCQSSVLAATKQDGGSGSSQTQGGGNPFF